MVSAAQLDDNQNNDSMDSYEMLHDLDEVYVDNNIDNYTGGTPGKLKMIDTGGTLHSRQIDSQSQKLVNEIEASMLDNNIKMQLQHRNLISLDQIVPNIGPSFLM